MKIWKSKKFLLIMALVIVALVGGTTGAVMAATGDGGASQAETQHDALLGRICEIYEENTGVTIDPDQLQIAFDQARDEMREQALENRLQALVDDGKITQDEADQLLEWWQSRPDVELPGLLGGQFGGRMMDGGGLHHWGAPPCAPDDSGEADA